MEVDRQVVEAAQAGDREAMAELVKATHRGVYAQALRLVCGHRMGLGDVADENYPKMTLVAPPRHGGSVSTRSLIPRVAHRSIGVLAAVTAATACVLEGSVAHGVAARVAGDEPTVSVEHPSGEFSVTLGLDPADPQKVVRSALLRTARLLMSGDVLVPSSLWNPVAKERSA